MAGAGPLQRADFAKLYAERLAFMDHLIGPNRWPEVDSTWQQLFNIKSSTRMREEVLLHSGFGHFAEIGEGEKVTYDSLVQGPSQSFTHVLYGKGYQIGLLAARHDLDGLIAKNAPLLGQAQRNSVQQLAATWWDNTITTGTSTTADGLTVLNASHTYLRGGGTWSNLATAALGQSALESAFVSFAKLKDLNGDPQPLPTSGLRLLIPPDLEPTAFELLKSRLRSDTTDNAQSFTYNKAQIISWPWLSSSTNWWVLSPKQYQEIYWFWNIRPETSHGFDFDTETAKSKILFACSYGCPHAKGIYGSEV
jgi:hypothetical protein